MYRCTECNAEYEVCPEFCECGNDVFQEIVYEEPSAAGYDDSYEEEEYYREPPRRRPPSRPKRRRLSEEELEELEEEKADRTKAIIAGVISLILCIVVFVAPPHKQKRVIKAQPEIKNERKVQAVGVDSYWDNTLPAAFKSKDPTTNLPVLRLSNISSVLRNYLIELGKEFSEAWKPNLVEGEGDCTIQFYINRDGGIEGIKMIKSNRNDSMISSVRLAMTTVVNVGMPPDDYKGELIRLAFKVDAKGTSKVYFPSN